MRLRDEIAKLHKEFSGLADSDDYRADIIRLLDFNEKAVAAMGHASLGTCPACDLLALLDKDISDE